MSRPKVAVSVSGEAANVALPRSLAQAWKDGTELSVVPLPPEAAVFLRGATRSSGFIAASVSSFSVEELFGFILAGVRTGKLIYVRGGARKTVSFRDAQVVFATSTEPWERLGAALIELKLLMPEELKQALSKVQPGARLGQVLTRSGQLNAARLYSAMTYLVREIVIDLFTAREGNVLFLEGVPPPEDELKLPDSTRDLALTGMRRAEEVRRLSRRLEAELVVGQGSGVLSGSGPGQRLCDFARPGVALRDLRNTFEGSEHAFLTLVDELLSSGALDIRQRTGETTLAAGRPAQESAIPSVQERYQGLVRQICDALKEAGQDLEPLRSFLSDPLPGMERAFADVTLSDEGVLDTAKVVENLGTEDATARLRAYEVLDAFVSYALFSARNVLPPEVADRLSREARQRQEEAG